MVVVLQSTREPSFVRVIKDFLVHYVRLMEDRAQNHLVSKEFLVLMWRTRSNVVIVLQASSVMESSVSQKKRTN